MTRFIPRNDSLAEQVANRLSSTIFKDVGTFVQYYNEGVINKNNDDTKETVRQLIDAYKDVRERKGVLAFISEEEVLIAEAISDLSHWVTLTRIQREVQDALEAKTITESDTLVILADGTVAVPRISELGSEILENIGADKLKNNEAELLKKLSTAETRKDDKVSVLVYDIVTLDGSFIKNIKAQITVI